LGSVIIDSQPLSVAVLAALLFGEALSPLGIAGLFIGVAGLLLLELPQEVVQHSTAALQSGGLSAGLGALQQGLQSGVAAAAGDGGGWKLTDSGEFWMLLAAQSMAVGTVMVRWVMLLVMNVMLVSGFDVCMAGCAVQVYTCSAGHEGC
jgi:drug/metabolite transporter (DMT)-like permease